MSFPVGSNEEERLAALQDLGIVGSAPDPVFDRITKLAMETFGVPIALITLLDREQQWFQSCAGLSLTTTPRSQAFCNYTVLSDDILVVEDALEDARFLNNPLVRGELGIRFYAGAPLALDAGRRLGALCLIGQIPRSMTSEERTRLSDLAAIVVSLLELHRSRNEVRIHRDALIASEERLRIAIETTGLKSWEYEGTEAPLEMSSECLAILGFAPHAHVGRRAIIRCIHQQDRHRLLSEVSWAGAVVGRSLNLDIRIIRASDREERWLSIRGRCFERRHARRLLGTLNDITDLQVRAQQQQGLALLGQIALREGNLDELFRASCDVLVRTLGADHACIAVGTANPTGHTLTIVAGAGKSFFETPEAPTDLKNSLLRRAFVATSPVSIVDASLEDDGWRDEIGERFGLRSAMAVGIGEPTRRAGAIAVGCTASRRFTLAETSFLEATAFVVAAASERRHSVATLRLRDRALDAVEQGIVICDATSPELPLVYMNPAAERQTGYTASEHIALGSSFLLRGEQAGDLSERASRQLAELGQFHGRIDCRHRDGRPYKNEVSVSSVRDEAGNATHYVAVHTDVTQRLKLEDEVRQAQKMEAVGKLTGGVAHDFNNLLTVILGNAEIIAERTSDPELLPLAEVVVQAAERGADTVQRLLAFGRRQDLQPESLNVNAVLSSLTNLLDNSVGEEITLRTRIAPGRLPTFVDRSQLETSILNLVINARDAMPRGGAVTVRSRAVEFTEEEVPPGLTPGPYVSLDVTDTGCGIEPDILDRVFEPFFTTKDVGKGTGLGLSMVYGFVQQSGGLARICSKIGYGTTVEILLPRTTSSHELQEPPSAKGPMIGRERVLVVEDQKDVREFVTSQLVSLGYLVSAVPDGPAALAELQTSSDVELLFTDVIMSGGLDGMQLAEEAIRLKPQLKILFTSGYTDLAAARSERFLDGSAPLLKKPYRRSELASAVRAALSSSAA